MDQSFTPAVGLPRDCFTTTSASAAKERDEAILAQLVQQLAPPEKAALHINARLIDVARWIGDSGNWKLLLALARITELQAAMVVSRCRPKAAATLLNIASGSESTELARRACADLINARLDALAGRESGQLSSGASASNPFTAPVPNEDVILRTMARLAAQHEQPESDAINPGAGAA